MIFPEGKWISCKLHHLGGGEFQPASNCPEGHSARQLSQDREGEYLSIWPLKLYYFFKVVEESRNAKEMMGWLEGKIKECKVRIAAEGFVFKPEDICDHAFNWFPPG